MRSINKVANGSPTKLVFLYFGGSVQVMLIILHMSSNELAFKTPPSGILLMAPSSDAFITGSLYIAFLKATTSGMSS